MIYRQFSDSGNIQTTLELETSGMLGTAWTILSGQGVTHSRLTRVLVF